MAGEFRVNTYQDNWQRSSEVIALRDGCFVVVWESYFNTYEDGDPVCTYVAAQFYNATGNPVGGEQVLRAVDGWYSGAPNITQLSNGNLVLTWMETDEDDIFTNGAHIMGQVLSASGTALGSAFQVDTVADFRSVNPEVVALGNGGFIISYGADGTTATPARFDDVYYRTYTAAGVPVGTDHSLNINSYDFDEINTKTAALTNGNSVVVWNSEAAIDDGTSDGQNQLRASLFGPAGQLLRADFGLTPHIGGAGDEYQFGYAVAPGAGGGFVVVNMDFTPNPNDGGTQGIYFSAYSASGQPIGAPRAIFEHGVVMGDFEIARLANGQYVVVWTQQSLVPSDVADDAYGMIISASGTPVSGAFEIGIDSDAYDEQAEVSVAALTSGGFVVTYTSDSIDADHEGIAGRIFRQGTAASETLTVDITGTMSGYGGNDRINGDARSNWLFGDVGNDTLLGNAGNDFLDGGVGSDLLAGGGGNDTFFVDSSSDRIYEIAGQGVDTVRSAASFSLGSQNVENLVLIGTAAINATGNTLANALYGNAASNALAGGGGRDTLQGGGGNDRLIGGEAADVLTGGAGSDKFVFNVAPIAANADRIADFSNIAGNNDTFELSRVVFTALKAGVLSAADFVVGSAAHDVSDRIIYNQANGNVYYDPNGSAAGVAQLIATLLTKPVLTAADFVVV